MLAVGQHDESGRRKVNESRHSEEGVVVTVAAVGGQRDKSA